MTDIESLASSLTPNMVQSLTSWCHDRRMSADIDDSTKRALVNRRLAAWASGGSLTLTCLGDMVRDVLLVQQETERLVVERTAEFARMCGLELDAEEDPVTAKDVRLAAADDVALRAGIAYAPEVLPPVLAGYLVRSWELCTQAFSRVTMMSELEIATGWGRRHAAAARDLLTLKSPPAAGSERSDPEGEQ